MSTKRLPLYQVDAFAAKVFQGNPAAVVPLEEWLPDKVLQQIALENNLSETAFYIPKGPGHFHIRWFTPTIEVNLCGHATLASSYVIFQNDPSLHKITLDSRSGELRVSKEGSTLFLDFPADPPTPAVVKHELEKWLGADILEAHAGKEDLLILLKSEEVVAKLRPNIEALLQLPYRGVIVTAPGHEVDFVSRFFCPNVGVSEDPATGSTHTVLTPYWSKTLGKKEMTARQLSARGGAFQLVDREERVSIGGLVIPYLQGTIEIPVS